MAVMGMMTIFAIGLLAVAPTIQHEIQREKEIEAIARGEEVANAIRQYVQFYNGQRLPESIDDLLAREQHGGGGRPLPAARPVPVTERPD